MNAEEVAHGHVPDSKFEGQLAVPIMTALLSWVAISVGFVGLKMLMEERPEFVGQPMTVAKSELIQESPQVITRKVSDDVSAIKVSQPESSDVSFQMNGRRDYRGLRTILDMSGEFRARYLLTNSLEEPIFVLFKCSHPRAEGGESQNLLAGDLKLQSSIQGTQENTTNAWFWSGSLEPRSSVRIEVSYNVASLKGVSYRVSTLGGNQVKHLRVNFNRQDLASMRFESGDGTQRPRQNSVVWERHDFLAPDFFSAQIEESRNLYSSLTQLLQIGPLICLLFLLAVSAVILVRQRVTAIQMLTIAAGYAFYFPLVLYLSANFNFIWALLLALVIPGVLLVNYARWLLGSKLGLFGAAAFLCLYQIFPTLAAFAGWKRGMVLLSLGLVTLAVLINLQNRLLKQRVALGILLIGCLAGPPALAAAEIQVLLPAELANKPAVSKGEKTNAIVAFDPCEYRIQHEGNHLRVEARISIRVVRAGENFISLFAVPVYLQTSKWEPPEPAVAHLASVTNRLALVLESTGHGILNLAYNVPVENREGKKRAQIPVAAGLAGNVRLESPRGDIEVLSGSLWEIGTLEKVTSYNIGVAGQESLLLEWQTEASPGARTASLQQAETGKEFYGIGITRGQHLTLMNSDGSCTHFAEFDIPVSQSDEFRMKLPVKARLISVSVNGVELPSPALEEQLCRIKLPSREAQQTAHRISFRIAYPVFHLGFAGSAELSLPELYQTAGALEWVVVLPNNFQTQVVSSGLEAQKSAPDLGRFGDYGRILKSHHPIYLARDLTPPGAVALSLKYRQLIPGISEGTE